MYSSSYQRFCAAYLKMCHFRTQIMFAHGSRGNGLVSDRKSLVLEGFLRIDHSRVIRAPAATGRRLELCSYGEPPKSRMIDTQKTSCPKTRGVRAPKCEFCSSLCTYGERQTANFAPVSVPTASAELRILVQSVHLR